MTGDPDYDMIRRAGPPPIVAGPLFRQYVDPVRIPDAAASSMITFRADFRPRALNYWLTNLQGALQHVEEENEHDIAHA